MRRRQFLATGTALLSVSFAGCAHPAVVLDMDAASADDIARERATPVDSGSEAYTVVAEARTNGSATRSGLRGLFDDDETVRVDGQFYDVTETPVGSSEVTVYDVLVDFNPENSTAETGEVRYEDLPRVDRDHLESVFAHDTHQEGDGFDVGVGYGPADDLKGESVFVPTQRYDILIRDGNRYRVKVESETASKTTYEYEVTEVASSVEAYAKQLRERYLFELTELTAEERSVVEEAIDGGYFDDSDAFRSVVETIRSHDGLDVNESYGTWLVAYENTDYVTYTEW